MRVVFLPGVLQELRDLPPNKRKALATAFEKLEIFGDQLATPHSSQVQGTRLPELRPRQGRSPWRALYQRVGDAMVVAVICSEAQTGRRGFARGITTANDRLDFHHEGNLP